jgi:hypothetical protein
MIPSYGAELLHITDSDIEHTFAPFVVEHFAPDGQRLADEERRLDAKYSTPAKVRAGWTNDTGQRTTDLVRAAYQSS